MVFPTNLETRQPFLEGANPLEILPRSGAECVDCGGDCRVFFYTRDMLRL